MIAVKDDLGFDQEEEVEVYIKESQVESFLVYDDADKGLLLQVSTVGGGEYPLKYTEDLYNQLLKVLDYD